MNWRSYEDALFRPRPTAWTAATFVLIAVVGVADFVTGPEITFSVFAALVWLGAELASSSINANLFVYTWNFCTRLLFLLLAAVVLARLRAMLVREREAGRTDALTGLINARGCEELASTRICRRPASQGLRRYADLAVGACASDQLNKK